LAGLFDEAHHPEKRADTAHASNGDPEELRPFHPAPFARRRVVLKRGPIRETNLNGPLIAGTIRDAAQDR
jgi:hypothetical protein